MAPYVYESLDLAKDAIRVLRLLRGALADNEIRCELFQAYLGDEGVSYEALSYTWGSMDKPLKITVDSSDLHVTENLYTALLQLRLPYQDRLLWVDAICIDQRNEKERGHQVEQMRHVYKTADSVLICLGTSDPYIDNFFAEINDDKRLKAVQTRGSSAVRVKIDPEIHAEFRIVFLKLMTRPWFRRVWVLQEVASARTATVMCGDNSMPAWLFASIPTIFDFPVPDHCQAVLDIMPGHSRRSSWWGETQDLRTLLVKFSASEATDERDKIYALLGISSDAYNSKVLLPDYSKDIRQVILETWSYMLFQEILDPSLHGFPDLGLTGFLEILECLPEWTLDWSVREGRDEILLRLVGARGIAASRMIAEERALLCSLAERKDHSDLFQLIISHAKLHVNVVDGLGDTPLHKAVRGGQRDKVEMLLSRKDMSLNSANLTRVTPLIEAVQLCQETMVNLLLTDSRIDVNHGIGGWTPLTKAIHSGEQTMVNLLLADTRIDPNRSVEGQTPMALAIRLGHEGISKALLAHPGIDPNRGGLSPLVEAVQGGHIQILKQLLDSSLLRYCNDGRAAWIKAVEEKREDMLPVLISGERAKCAVNKDWELCMEQAIMSSLTSAVKTILTCQDVDINKQIQWEVWKQYDRRVYMSNTDISMNKTTRVWLAVALTEPENMITPLWLAVGLEDEEMVTLLLENGADIEKQDFRGCLSPLALACVKGDSSMAQLLLDQGASPDSRNRDGINILEMAAGFQGLEDRPIVRFLFDWIKKPGNAWVLDRWLFSAVQKDRRDWFMELMLTHGINSDTINKAGEGALGLATALGDGKTALRLRTEWSGHVAFTSGAGQQIKPSPSRAWIDQYTFS